MTNRTTAAPSRDRRGLHQRPPVSRVQPRGLILAVGLTIALIVVAIIKPWAGPSAVGTSPTASPTTPSAEGSASAAPLAAAAMQWTMGEISFAADHITITTNATVFQPVAGVNVDGGVETTASGGLSLDWFEGGVEMRLNLDFTADAGHWWVDQIWRYDGRNPGAWIKYAGRFFETAYGGTYRGNLDLMQGADRLHIGGLVLRAFVGPNLPPATSCANGRWPTMPVSCTTAALTTDGIPAGGDALIWLTTYAVASAAYDLGAVPSPPPQTAPVWVFSSESPPHPPAPILLLHVVDATRVGVAVIYNGPPRPYSVRMYPPVAPVPSGPPAPTGWVGALDRSGQVTGYAEQVDLADPAAKSVPIYGSDLRTRVGSMVPGIGFVATTAGATTVPPASPPVGPLASP